MEVLFKTHFMNGTCINLHGRYIIIDPSITVIDGSSPQDLGPSSLGLRATAQPDGCLPTSRQMPEQYKAKQLDPLGTRVDSRQ